jgi:hypothetical protein
VYVLLDEGVPVPLLELVRIDKSHDFEHVVYCNLAGKKDRDLFPLAAQRGVEVLVALDRAQLNYEPEWRALRQAGLHHVSLRQRRTTQSKRGTLRVLASIALALPRVLDHLAACKEPQVVDIALLADSARFDSVSHHKHAQAQGRVGS